MAAPRLAVLERPAVSKERPRLQLVPAVTESHLPFEYQYERLRHDAYRIPWLTSPSDGIISAGQTWFFIDDCKHANPLSGELRVSFDAGSVPIIVIDRRACQSLEGFLRDILAGKAWYVHS